MSDSNQGKITVAPDVLVTIARMSALSVPGVSRMAHVTGGVNRLFRRGGSEGVRIEVEDNTVVASLYLVLKPNVNIREVSRNVQGIFKARGLNGTFFLVASSDWACAGETT